jgi:hypothetical protein
MMISYHGGKCCGIKVIHMMGDGPDEMVGEFENDDDQALVRDRFGEDVSSDQNVFVGKRPRETRRERLDAYLEYLDKHRPKGIIEITLADRDKPGGCDCASCVGQTPLWRPVLEERGFKEINNCLNSNSGRRVYVFHRNRE